MYNIIIKADEKVRPNKYVGVLNAKKKYNRKVSKSRNILLPSFRFRVTGPMAQERGNVNTIKDRTKKKYGGLGKHLPIYRVNVKLHFYSNVNFNIRLPRGSLQFHEAGEINMCITYHIS